MVDFFYVKNKNDSGLVIVLTKIGLIFKHFHKHFSVWCYTVGLSTSDQFMWYGTLQVGTDNLTYMGLHKLGKHHFLGSGDPKIKDIFTKKSKSNFRTIAIHFNTIVPILCEKVQFQCNYRFLVIKLGVT